MEFFKIRRTIPFMRYALVFNVISFVTFLAAVFFLATRGLHFSVEFTGGTLMEVSYQHTADVERFYQAADVFVLPTAFETFSRSAHEAAACGLPVVAPPVSGIRDLIGRDEAGIVVAREASSVAQALVALAGDAHLRARLADEARRRASARNPAGRRSPRRGGCSARPTK